MSRGRMFLLMRFTTAAPASTGSWAADHPDFVDLTVIVTGPAAEGCDLLRGTARGIATGGAVEVPALELVAIPQPCPA